MATTWSSASWTTSSSTLHSILKAKTEISAKNLQSIFSRKHWSSTPSLDFPLLERSDSPIETLSMHWSHFKRGYFRLTCRVVGMPMRATYVSCLLHLIWYLWAWRRNAVSHSKGSTILEVDLCLRRSVDSWIWICLSLSSNKFTADYDSLIDLVRSR